MRKLVLCLFILINIFILSSCNSSPKVEDTEENKAKYLELVNQLKTEIASLEEEYNELFELNNNYKTQYNNLKNQGSITEESFYSWFNRCNIYDVRGNVKITTTAKSFGIGGSSKTYSGSGAIVCIDSGYAYIVTSYYITSQYKSDFQGRMVNATYVVNDCYQVEYQGTLFYEDSSLALSLIRITIGNSSSDLYEIPLAKEDVAIDSFVCNIYSLKSSAYNHMNFNKVVVTGYESTYTNAKLFGNYLDTNSGIYGAITVDFDGNLCGIVLLTNVVEEKSIGYSVPISSIKTFLKNAGFKF